MKSGIYMIINKVNNKIYIGQSVNIRRRLSTHLRELQNGVHCNEHLQKSFDKYGKHSFEFNPIEYCKVAYLNEKEMYYINKYQSYDNNFGYNNTFGGDSNFTFTNDIIQKMQDAHSYEFVPVIQFSKEKTMVKKYSSISEASRNINGTPSGIRNCAEKFSNDKGLSKTYKGYIWIYEYDLEKFEKCDIQSYLKENRSIRVNKYEYPTGKFVCSYETVSDAAIDNDISNDVISLCVRLVQKNSNGYTYRKDTIDNRCNIKVEQAKRCGKPKKPVFSMDKSTHEFVKRYDCDDELLSDGFIPAHVNSCCNGKRNTHGGYMWAYCR